PTTDTHCCHCFEARYSVMLTLQRKPAVVTIIIHRISGHADCNGAVLCGLCMEGG
ncbi:hypothetical protein B0H12DRAFT_1134387, partial [Mycena haematopus]